MIGSFARVGAAAWLMLALAAPPQAAADAAQPHPRAAGAAGMTTAPMKGNGSGVIVRYRVDGTPQPGAAVPVVLSFDGVTDPAGALLRFQTEGGLSLGSAAQSRTLPAGAATTLTIEVTPSAAGTAYLHVFTTQYGAASAISIPVQVGKAPSELPEAQGLKQGPNGEKIRSLQVK